MSNVLKEYRCYVNNYLLCKASGIGQVEIVNPSNRIMNYTGPSRVAQHIGPTGQDFGTYALEMRCPTCGKLLGRAVGTTLMCEFKCYHCNQPSVFDLSAMQWQRFYNLSDVRKKQLENQILATIGVK